MLQDLFQEQKELLLHFFDHVDMNQSEKLVDLLFLCKGTIILSGVGKSGFIAQKLAMTLTSIGKRAQFLFPANALHGDIGIVYPEDIFLCLSKSGETQELLNLFPFIKKKRAKIVALVSEKNSTMEKRADMTILLPVEKELCPFNIAPTTSPAVQLLYGDILAVALMKKMNFSLEDFALNHPAGAIGKKMNILVEDLMIPKKDSPLCRKEDKLIDMLPTITSKKCGCLIAVDAKGYLEGIFTDGDMRRAIEKDKSQFLEKKIFEFMNHKPKVISPKELAWTALKVMEEDKKKLITVLPVVSDDNEVLGIVRMHDILQEGIKS